MSDEKYVRKHLKGASFEKGYATLQEHGVSIVGLSPGNSYFRREKINDLLRKSSELFSKVIIMVPDKPAKHTYRAIGYSDAKAEKKARLNSNTLKNHARRAIDAITASDVEIEIMSWSNIELHPRYIQEYDYLRRLYETNPLFRISARKTTQEVLESKIKPGIPIDVAIEEGVKYLLKELAYLTVAPHIYHTNSIAYVYHNRWPIFEDYVEGKFDGKKREDLGFVVME